MFNSKKIKITCLSAFLQLNSEGFGSTDLVARALVFVQHKLGQYPLITPEAH